MDKFLSSPRLSELWAKIKTLIAAKADAGHSHGAGDITSGTLTVARGGTGATTFTAGNILFGNGTGAVTTNTPLNTTRKLGFAYGTCPTPGGTVAKTVIADNFVLRSGAVVIADFLSNNVASKPTLNVNNTGAIEIHDCTTNNPIGLGVIDVGMRAVFVYDGRYWMLMNPTTSATKEYVRTETAKCLSLTGGMMRGPIAMNGAKVTGVGAPESAAEAANKEYVDEQIAIAGGSKTITADIRFLNSMSITMFSASILLMDDGYSLHVAGDQSYYFNAPMTLQRIIITIPNKYGVKFGFTGSSAYYYLTVGEIGSGHIYSRLANISAYGETSYTKTLDAGPLENAATVTMCSGVLSTSEKVT